MFKADVFNTLFAPDIYKTVIDSDIVALSEVDVLKLYAKVSETDGVSAKAFAKAVTDDSDTEAESAAVVEYAKAKKAIKNAEGTRKEALQSKIEDLREKGFDVSEYDNKKEGMDLINRYATGYQSLVILNTINSDNYEDFCYYYTADIIDKKFKIGKDYMDSLT